MFVPLFQDHQPQAFSLLENGSGNFDIKALSMQALHLLKKLFWHSGNQSLSLIGDAHQGIYTRIQDFALCKVSCQMIVRNPMSPAKESVQASSPQESALAICNEYNPQVPTQRPQGLRM
jgi:hypothetical protein